MSSITSKTFRAGLVAVFTIAAPWACWASNISTVTADGYTFYNFDGPGAGNTAATGTNMNGISNSGAAVGFAIENNGNLNNFVRNPNGTTTPLNINGSTTAMALGINSSGSVVGTDGNGNAFIQTGGSTTTFIPGGGSSATAFGINDHGAIVGQYTVAGGQTPGFYVTNSSGANLVTINAPSGPNAVNAQSINNNGVIVGFYVGTDGQFHGFTANISSASKGTLTGTAIADPTIPSVAGEPGATFVFSQVLGVNDSDIAVGYYGDSTTSQHGFVYNLSTSSYTFVDDPAEGFSNGVEVTQITGINNSGDLTGFYSDANGVFHGFVACPVGATCAISGVSTVPEPGSLAMAGLGLAGLLAGCFGRRRRSV